MNQSIHGVKKKPQNILAFIKPIKKLPKKFSFDVA